MDFLTRAFKNVYRKKSKSVLLFITFFIIANIVFCGFAVLAASDNIATEIRRKLGTEVFYQVDYDKYYEYRNKLCEEQDDCEYKQPPALDINVAMQLAEHENVSFFDIKMSSYFSYANSEHKIYYTEQDKIDFPWWFDDEREKSYHTNSKGGAGRGIEDFEKGIVKLSQGRLYSEEDAKNKNAVIVISEEVALMNGYQLGDLIEIGSAIGNYDDEWNLINYTYVTEQFEIIGLFEVVNQEDQIWEPTQRLENVSYMPYSMVNQIREEAFYTERKNWGDNNSEYVYTPSFTVVYNIDDPLNIDKFREESQKVLTSDFHMLYANDHQFKTLTEPINSIKTLARIATYAMVINGAVIVSLITALTLRERNYEIGVFLSIGVSKLKIISQFFVELLAVAAIAFTLSLGSGHLLTQQVSETLISSGVIGEPDDGGGGVIMYESTISSSRKGILPNPEEEVDFNNILENTTFGLTLDVVVNVFLSGLFIILISTLIPSLLIMRFNPKKILADK